MSALTIFVIIGNVTATAYCEPLDMIGTKAKPIALDKAIEHEAELWVDSLYEENIEIGEIIPVISPNTYSFCVSFNDGYAPCGYAVFDYYDGEFVVSEYTDVKGADDIYTNIREGIVSDRADNCCKIIGDFMFRTGPLDYAVGYIDELGDLHNEDSYGNEVKTLDYVIEAVCSYSTFDSIYISLDTFNNNKNYQITYSTTLSGVLYTDIYGNKNRFKCFDSAIYTNKSKSYNCAVSANLHVLAIKNLVGDFSNKDLAFTYDKLMKLTKKTKCGTGDNNITLYAVYPEDANIALIKYLSNNTKYKKTEYNKLVNPTAKSLKDEIRSNHPVVLSYHIITKKGKADHAVTVYGFRTAKKIKSDKSYNYLAIFDSNTPNPKFINYSTVDFVGTTLAYSYDFK